MHLSCSYLWKSLISIHLLPHSSLSPVPNINTGSTKLSCSVILWTLAMLFSLDGKLWASLLHLFFCPSSLLIPSGLSLNTTYSEPSLTLEYRWSVTPLPAVPAHVHMALHYTALQWPVCPSMSFSGAQPAWGIGLCFLHQLCLYCLAQYQTHNGTQYILVQQINKIKIDSIM